MSTQRLIEQIAMTLLELVKDGRTIAALKARGVPVEGPVTQVREMTDADRTRIRKANGLVDALVWKHVERDGLCLELDLTQEQVEMACGDGRKARTASTPTEQAADAKTEAAPVAKRNGRRLKRVRREVTDADRARIWEARNGCSEKEWMKSRRDETCRALGLTRKQLAGVLRKNGHAAHEGSPKENATNGFDLLPWPGRDPIRGSKKQPPKKQEYPVDAVDHEVVIAARRAITVGSVDESRWGTIKYMIAAHRRITLKQIDGITSSAARANQISPIGH